MHSIQRMMMNGCNWHRLAFVFRIALGHGCVCFGLGKCLLVYLSLYFIGSVVSCAHRLLALESILSCRVRGLFIKRIEMSLDYLLSSSVMGSRVVLHDDRRNLIQEFIRNLKFSIRTTESSTLTLMHNNVNMPTCPNVSRKKNLSNES